MEKKGLSKCRKDKDHDLRYGTGPPAEFRWVSMRCLSHWSGQQQHLLQWHKKCSGLKRLKKDPDYSCTRCQGTARPLDGRPQKEVQIGPDKLEVVASFCYLGNMLSAAGGCELSTTTRVKTAWKKFKDLLPVLSSRYLFQNTWPCVRSTMLHASETWLLTKPNLQCLQRNDGAMIRHLQCQAARHCHHQVQWATYAAWHWGSGPHSEGENSDGMDMWNAPVVQSRQPLTYRLM